MNPDKPLGSQADDFPTSEDGRCCFWLPDPSDDPCEILKNSENENQCRAYVSTWITFRSLHLRSVLHVPHPASNELQVQTAAQVHCGDDVTARK